MKEKQKVIAIIGVGPRGVSILERIAARKPTEPLRIALFDDSEIGAGRIWSTTQTQTLCMNTLAGAVTLFTEPGATIQAPVLEGPTMFEWVQALRGETLPPAKQVVIEQFAPAVPEAFAEEIQGTRPESNPSRALYGLYIKWVYQVARAHLPENVEVVEYKHRVTSITSAQDYDRLQLDTGETVVADATVLAIGWQKPAWNQEETLLAEAASAGVIDWVSPDNPVEQNMDLLPAEPVLVRGLGMGFFDVMAMATIDRGGQFVTDDCPAGLRYIPSGKEPRFIIASGRGYPYLPKSEYHSLPPKAELPRLRAVIDALAQAPSIDFATQVWPAIVRDAHAAYYQVLAKTEGALGQPLVSIIELIDATPIDQLTTALREVIVDPDAVLDLDYYQDPLKYLAPEVISPEELTSIIAQSMAEDIHQAELARESAIKAALWCISAARKPASILGSGRYTWQSRRKFNEFMAFGQMVGSGPPLFRTRQLLALIDAGLVTFLGSRPLVNVDDEVTMVSATTNTPVRAKVLVDAWMHSPDVRMPQDPLALSLQDRLRPYDIEHHLTASPEVYPATRQVVHADGTLDPRLHLVGIPTFDQLPDTTISPMPGTDPLMLQETDSVAEHLLQVVRD